MNVKFALVLSLIASSLLADSFPETWGYLMKGEEASFPARSTLTDVACFSASVDEDGKLTGGALQPPSLPGGATTLRSHLVITFPWNTTLAHIYLDPDLPFYHRILSGIVERSAPFQGVQIDIESVSTKDRAAFQSFLVAVKKALPPGKIFSVAVPARWDAYARTNPEDPFNYAFVNQVADRVIVMAYDEHHRTGAAGPIASLPWCQKIYAYALQTIDPDKLVMGIPLYGRSWQSPSFAKAYKNLEILRELRAKTIRPTTDRETGGTYQFQETVSVQVYFETRESLAAKLNLYAARPIRGVAVWRISQEPPGFWESLLP
jgi:spore germination protein YaaH